jgi:NADPH:quinone reductase
MKAILVRETGGPEKMLFEEVPVPVPGKGQALVRIAVSGVNFIDIYFRIGLYKADLPFTPGMEAAGVVEAVGEGVTEVQPGDRVAYAMQRGSYAQFAVVPAWQLVKVPAGLGLDLAAAAMLQGMTAHYLTHSTFRSRTGRVAWCTPPPAVRASLLCQMAKRCGGARHRHRGRRRRRQAMAREAGADEVILYNEQDFGAEVKRHHRRRGVDVVYDSVGASTFMGSLDCLRPARHDGHLRQCLRPRAGH